MLSPGRKETDTNSEPRKIELAGQDLSINDLRAAAANACHFDVTRNSSVLDRIRQAEEVVSRAVANGQRVYGITTGFGGMAETVVPSELAAASQSNLMSFLNAGAGDAVPARETRMAMILRANMLLKGISGVRLEIIERLVAFLNANATPVVRQLGSIGASGDLVPLASIARAVTGEGQGCKVELDGEQLETEETLARLGLSPLKLNPKEGLAIVNGTSFSSAIAADSTFEARKYLGISLASHAMMIRSMCGHLDPYQTFVHEAKPHPGQSWVASTMRELLGKETCADVKESDHLQDRYSLRCLPQYIGPIAETIERVARTVETEMNSVTDNPLIDVEQERFYQSGNFLGQYVGVAMDDLRRSLGLLAKHLDVQIAQLMTPEFSHGLPASLTGSESRSFNMGLKGLQITGNSIMPMLVYLGNPLVDHYPTHAEQFNQNINGLSWGTANLARQSVDLFSHYSAVTLICAVQAVDLRSKLTKGHFDGRSILTPITSQLYEAVYDTVGRSVGQDKPLIENDSDQSIEHFLEQLTRATKDAGSVAIAVQPIVDSVSEAELA